ncbi:MAG: hypothetical protein ABFD49_01660 [Armatimonadota bacterium]
MTCIRVAALLLCIILAESGAGGEEDDRGFLDRPPVFIDNEYDFPLTGMGAEIPVAGETIPAVDSTDFESDHANQGGVNVQPDLSTKFTTTRLGALRGFNGNWAAMLTIPIQRTRIRGRIGGEDATSTDTALGDIAMLAKKMLWNRGDNEKLVATFGIELPTGKDDAVFDQSNAVTNAYYTGNTRRIPLSWQPGSGTWDGYLALAYSKAHKRLSYEGLIAAKLNSRGDEDVKIGNTFIAAVAGTYGIVRQAAVSLSAVMRTQGSDSYPNAPSPGIDQTALAGTTVHGTILYLNPSIRLDIAKKATVGFGWRYPVIQPDDGLVPDVQGFIIFYPDM